jgi:hypothetical protein
VKNVAESRTGTRIHMANTPLTTTIFMAVRHSIDGYDWFDVATASCSTDIVRQRVEADNLSIPAWAQANPLARIVRSTVIEGVMTPQPVPARRELPGKRAASSSSPPGLDVDPSTDVHYGPPACVLDRAGRLDV